MKTKGLLLELEIKFNNQFFNQSKGTTFTILISLLGLRGKMIARSLDFRRKSSGTLLQKLTFIIEKHKNKGNKYDNICSRSRPRYEVYE